MYCRSLVQDYADVASLVGLCDLNQPRMDLCNRYLGTSIPTFKDFREMLRRTEPDTVIVTSIDSTHHRYIVEALEFGCDVITEKPMTIDDEKCGAILAAERRTGRKVTVTFNYRYVPHHGLIRELIRDGAIGRVLSVDFHWYLDTVHGADYFRRWHRRMENSGGLLVHKACHHFDLVNWWIGSEPAEVFAWGERAFYGPTRTERGERCLTCDYKGTCEVYLDLTASDHLRELYLNAESEDGYYRDRCVFSEEIDIYDTMAAAVRYRSGTLMSYSLNAFMPYEGYQVAFNGDRGRLEVVAVERAPGAGPSLQMRLVSHGRPVQAIETPAEAGEHGGGDRRLRDALFRDGPPDPLNRLADSWAGAMALLTGVAANKSIATGQPVKIERLLKGEEKGAPVGRRQGAPA